MIKRLISASLCSIPEGNGKESVEVKTEDDASKTAESASAPARRRGKNRRPVISDTFSAIPVAAFHRLVGEISADRRSDMRWEAKALEALHVDAEAYLVDIFGRGNKRRRMARVKTLEPVHFRDECEE